MAKNYEAWGKIDKIGPRENVSDKLAKRVLWLYQAETYEGNIYENYLQMEFINKNCDMLDSWGECDFVKVTFKIAGRKYKKDEETPEKVFCNMVAWKVENGKGVKKDTGGASAPATPANASVPAGDGPPIPGDVKDDLPF